MKRIHSLVLAGAVAASFGAFAANTAKAETIYTEITPTATITTSNQAVVNETYTAIGTRKVGLVGYRPYPMKASRVESSTVINNPARTVVYTPGVGATTSSSVITTTDGGPVAYTTGGGTYYTEDGLRYYRNPNLNISVRRTGSFND